MPEPAASRTAMGAAFCRLVNRECAVRVEKWGAPEGDVVNAVYYFADAESVAELAHFPRHREAKDQADRWYDGYRIVISEVTATYGDGRLEAEES